ncbi:hypothetical protein [Flavobacterium muglaense]|uniref:ATP-binding protein n=1 Tax=Flavobacterium muglaense TaxID=2764716 RepID=A0A923MZN8_9FLAO|nr:hypothetical protein [Flavobacterium muglaense]MBC5837568.1 hypothetical protein [Flavobacterium muglaense]MBC5844095.1 hypothetical protein [Flavobacterium muglaense]
MKISIKNEISYLEIEKAYKVLKKSSNVDLYIPANITGKQLGIYSEIIQLIITWSRLSTGKLYIHYNSTTLELEDKIDVMFNRYWNFVAGCMGYKNGIYLLDQTEVSAIVAKVIKERTKFFKLNENWKKGTNSFIPSVQHSANPFPSAFYFSNGTLKSKKEIIELSKNILIDISKSYISGTSTFVLEHYDKLIGEIIFELIENTHYWSQSDYSNKTFPTGLRGLVFSSHHGNKETLLNNCKDDKPLYEYISNLITNNVADNVIVEISVFDSGSGLASKWSKKDISDFNSKDVIYEAIIDCLIKNNTSDKTSSYERGFGLHNMMKLLGDRKGFLKLRTNGLKLVRDFQKKPFNGYIENNREDYKLDDWHSIQNKAIPTYKTEGTMFSIFLPIQIN